MSQPVNSMPFFFSLWISWARKSPRFRPSGSNAPISGQSCRLNRTTPLTLSLVIHYKVQVINKKVYSEWNMGISTAFSQNHVNRISMRLEDASCFGICSETAHSMSGVTEVTSSDCCSSSNSLAAVFLLSVHRIQHTIQMHAVNTNPSTTSGSI